MYKELIKIGQKNIQYLKACLSICEAHLWGGTRQTKQKYLQQLGRLKVKVKEEQLYIEYYTNKIKEDQELETRISQILNLETS